MNKKWENPMILEPKRITIDCYRFKIEVSKEGYVRIYAFNPVKKGDVAIIIKPTQLELVWEHGKPKILFKDTMTKAIFTKVFGHDRKE